MSESQSGQPSNAPDANPDVSPVDRPGRQDAADPQRAEAAPFELSQDPVTHQGPETTTAPPSPAAPAYEHLGELPATYGTQSVYLVAYDPTQLFAYWDVDWSAGPHTPYALHVYRADGSLEQRIDILAADTGKYLPVERPGRTYFVELGRYGRDGGWQVIATSTNVTMPPAGLAGETEPKFATLPFHLSFQRLMELIQDGMGRGENLTAALARLQQGDRNGLSALAGSLSHLGPEPLHTLETLLGQKFNVSSGGGNGSPAGNGDARHLHRDRHDVLAAGAFSSESLSSAHLASGQGFVGGGSETLSSGAFSAGGLGGSENLSSGGFSSGVLGGLGGSETLAAYTAGLSSESLAAFSKAPGSETWRLASHAESSGSGGFGGGNDLTADERAVQFLRAIEQHLGMLGGLFSALNSERSGG